MNNAFAIEFMTKRKEALAWWEELSPEQKQAYWEGYSTYSPSVTYSQLTGHEIQNIWAVQTNDQWQK